MKGIEMYTRIQEMKNSGFSQNKTAKTLKLHRKTVKKYWNMTVDDYNDYLLSVKKTSQLEQYEKEIISWLIKYPSISSAQVCDWLKEEYRNSFKERTVSRYVNQLRERIGIPKTATPREYVAVDDLPAGRQMQVDFGELVMPNAMNNSKTRVRFAVFVLSHSRYKFVYFQSRPFHTVDLITAMKECFIYFGGMTDEIVFDQDSIVCVSENAGDIIFTYEFEKFKQECGFSVYMCRAADPESKGKVENAVRYVKHGFLENRMYPYDDDTLNHSGKGWLERTANAKIHGTTRKIPAEVFKDEREFLKPVPCIENLPTTMIMRTVRKDNTIIYCSNRYSLPLGTYPGQTEVEIRIESGILRIYTVFGEFICEHPISFERGVLIRNTHHDRDTTSKVDRVQQELDDYLDHKATGFLSGIRADKPRYARDQFKIVRQLVDQYGKDNFLKAASFCMENRLFSANTARDFLTVMNSNSYLEDTAKQNTIPVNRPEYHVTVEKRSLDVYAKAGDAV